MKRMLSAVAVTLLIVGAWQAQAITNIPGLKANIKLVTAFKANSTVKFTIAIANGSTETVPIHLSASVYIYKGSTINSGIAWQSGALKGPADFTLVPGQTSPEFPFSAKVPSLAKGTYMWRIQPLASKVFGNTHYPLAINDLKGTLTVK
jgi:hypothetical protein